MSRIRAFFLSFAIREDYLKLEEETAIRAYEENVRRVAYSLKADNPRIDHKKFIKRAIGRTA